MIDAARRGATFFKFVLSPDPNKEDPFKDLDLWELTRNSIGKIQTRFGPLPFVGVIHNDHTPLRHVHGFFLVPGRLSRQEFASLKKLWKIASFEAARQRRMLDRVQNNPRLLRLRTLSTRAREATLTTPPRTKNRVRTLRPMPLQPGCGSCGYGLFTGIARARLYCPSCHKPLGQKRTRGRGFGGGG
jgi:hypothetical protein